MNLSGTDGYDFLVGASDADTIRGLGGPDRLEGRAGDDLLDGGDGNDELSGGLGADSVIGGAGNDRFVDDDIDSGGNDTLDGGPGDDLFEDHLGHNVLRGGDGADFFSVWNLDGGSDIASGGAGTDTWRIRMPWTSGTDNDYVVTDFQSGAGGDLIDVRELLYYSAADLNFRGGNPFDPALGFLRFVPSGADAQLQWDRDGAGKDQFAWITVLSLRNVAVTALSEANIFGGIPLDGSGIAGRTIEGSADGERLTGWIGDDLLNAGGGDDLLNPFGGSGDDYIFLSSLGNDTLNGGDGNDYLYDWLGDNQFFGGKGDDRFSVAAFDDGVNVLNGGSGSDEYIVEESQRGTNYRVTDFATGAGGDRLNLITVLERMSVIGVYAQGNPFDPALGIFRLVQSGADTLVQIDGDGAAGPYYTWVTVITLSGVQKAALTADNFVGPLHPDGTLGAADTLSGGSAGESLVSDFDGDLIVGLDGNDSLYGGGGNDRLEGGTGNDWFYGGLGNDVMVGGEGEDSFSVVDLDYVGDDQLFGGAGNDYLADYAGSNLLSGGDGNDFFDVWSDGPLFVSNTLTGGAGRDTYRLSITRGDSYVVTDFRAGAGGDFLDLDYLLRASGIVGQGKGYSDGNPFTQGYLRFVQSGADTLLQVDLDADGTNFGWVTELRLKDLDRTRISAENFVGEFLVGTEAADTLIGGLGNDTIRGLGGNDVLEGAEGRDTLEGGAGADTMRGGTEGDTYYVDNRADVVIETGAISQGGPLLAAGPEPLPAGTGSNIDTVIAQVNYTLSANVENLTLAGTAALAGTGNGSANLLTGNSGANRLAGLGGVDILEGGGGADTLDGGIGNDTLGGGTGADQLKGGAGNDLLVGGTGADAFVFDTALSSGGNTDTIPDFSSGSDKIRLDDDVFTTFDGPTSATLAAGAFRAGAGVTSASDADDRILYDQTTGLLYYDADGTGSIAPVAFAVLGTGTHPTITASDFLIVG